MMTFWKVAVLAIVLAVTAGGMAPAQTAITLGIGKTVGFGPLVLAARTGLFERHGLAVTLKTVAPDALAKDLAAGSLQCAGAPIEDWIVWNARNVRTRILLLLDGSGDAGLLARPDVATLGALKGKTVATGAADSRSAFLLAWMLQNAGVHRRDVKTVVLPPDQAVQAVLSGKVEAAAVGEEAAAGQRPGALHLIPLPADDPAASEALGCTAPFLKAQPAAARALAQAFFDALAAMNNDPAKADATIGDGLGRSGEAFVAAAKGVHWFSLDENRRFFATRFDPFAATAGELLLEMGVTDTKPDPKTLVDGRALGLP